MKLKCKDLQIYDWVKDKHDFPMQVRTIGEDYLYMDFEGNEWDVWEYDDDTYPPYGIPITEEILKKNGLYFGLTSQEQDLASAIGAAYDEHWVLDEGDGCIITVDFPKDGDVGQIAIVNTNTYTSIILGRDELFVHELQHALRLAGLREMANNFKI